ncbi:MAG: TRAP transporter small permease [Gammaproteobacteria bacterium]|jgi:TRAP-type C4-dicarboxylate transport system permease small subunit|uniref:TRAP transporter small permease n=1 Tax=Marinomonas TaxID=28253 RepID=UPI000C1EA7D9|nr:TRAP transporter small permease [Marinomonas sp. BSi20584]MBU1297397.1 TRAP transporter small permease [Gammaproteobacteria bacterium]MBU2237100.1 TRAP transporter small permease [Gammaproteobacteria bacterium]MBU2320513.1 TRAP transporter small permease [Gammaproteobacteria bacterium]MBU2411410.1 TRAP transporter small permease [Gammaproteobacteria bacterium]PJE56446.1 TRAP transporter [Marinomonas sp. BSi20584]|tara:strand:+ start:33527 stop:34048 length:522 start_codon:yes stop_codon:yes gene_type:complete
MLAIIRKLADGIISLSAALGALGLIFEVIIILADVIGRAMGSPLYGSQDIVTMTMVILLFGAMALCDRQGGHIAVDLFERSYSAVLNRFIDVFSALLGAVIFVGIAYAVNESAKISTMLNLSTNLLLIPKAWFQNGLSVFALITAAGMALRAVELTLSGRDIRKVDTDKGDAA